MSRLPIAALLAVGVPLATSMLSALGLMFAVGCGGTVANPKQAAPISEAPLKEFEWGMKRLERALQLYRPGGSKGLNITDRKLDSQLFPPNDENPTYRARVTITTEIAFMHGRRKSTKEGESNEAPDESPEIDDPFAEKSDDWDQLIDSPGTGPRASAAAARIETRSLENETIFDMAYVEGHWRLVRQPELKHEQLWFKYAFE